MTLKTQYDTVLDPGYNPVPKSVITFRCPTVLHNIGNKGKKLEIKNISSHNNGQFREKIRT